MSNTWTKGQSQAINARGGSLIVSAAAGSGKTTVLVERVMRRITEEPKIDADRMLIVTYTKLAAAELKERLINKLNERIAKNPFDQNLLRQQKLMTKAQISTIHSYCSKIVKEYFYILDIDRNFRILDDSEKSLIINDALDMTLESMYADGEPDFFYLVEAFGGTKDDKELQKTILKVYEFLDSHPFPDDFINSKLEMFTTFSSVKDSVWGKILLSYANEAADYLRALVDSCKDIVLLDQQIFDCYGKAQTSDEAVVDSIERALETDSLEEVSKVLKNYVPLGLTAIRNAENPELVKIFKANREKFKDTVSKLREYFDYSEKQVKEDVADLFVVSQQLFNCVRQFMINYQNLKAERKVADYSDLEHWTIKLLVDSKTKELTDIAHKIRSRFDEIMVDEYQDANETQDIIFNSLSQNGENLFFVGDVKQSIYGFRQAMPQLFLNRRENSVLYDEENEQFPAKIFLDMNFRSINGVVDAVNYYFEKLMSLSVGDIVYDDTESLKCGAKYIEQPPSVAYHLLEINKDEDEDPDEEEAKYIATIIHKMIKDKYQVQTKTGYRDITYGDFAILMYSAKGHANIYADVLNRNMIPATSNVKYSFLEAHEVEIMSNMLSVIDNPTLDIELLSVLMSPIYGFTADDIVNIRHNNRYVSLYSAVIVSAENGNSKCKHFLSELAYFRDISVTVEVCDLLNIIYDRTGYMSIVSALTDNDIAADNLRMLKEYAKSYESGTGKGLSRFVSYLNRLKDDKSDINGAVDLNGASNNAVRILTVHGSKGLEFPVCIIANTSRKFTTDVYDRTLIHTELGLGMKRKIKDKNVTVSTMPYRAISLTLKRDEMSEKLRVLYVAMTRAKQKLIMLSSHQKIDSHLSGVSSKLTDSKKILPFAVRNCDKPSQWITMCAMLHPDGKILRDRAGCSLNPDSSAKFPFEIVICEPQKVKEAISDTENYTDETFVQTTQETSLSVDDTVIKTLIRNTEFLYKKQGVSKLVNKISASELSHRDAGKKYDKILSEPVFMSDKKLTAAGRGTALHAFMQFCDFNKARTDIKKEIERLENEGYISSVQAESIDVAKAQCFVNSDLVNRCINSSEIYKEYRFTTKIPASKVDPDIDPEFRDTEVILQGAVDLAFVENGELVIVDYKTDNVKDVYELYDRYHSQLELYKDAMEQCTDYKVKECLIYSIRHSEYITV